MTIEVTAQIVQPTEIDALAEVGHYALIGAHPPNRTLEATKIGAGAVIRSHTVIYASNQIGRDFQTGHGVMIRECNEIGDDVSIGTHSNIEHHVNIGHGVRLHSNVFVPEFTVIGEGVWVGPGVIMTNAKYPNTPGAKANLKGPKIGKGAVIGAGAILLPGISIGEYAMIAAGAVVTRDVDDGDVVVGHAASRNEACMENVDLARRGL